MWFPRFIFLHFVSRSVWRKLQTSVQAGVIPRLTAPERVPVPWQNCVRIGVVEATPFAVLRSAKVEDVVATFPVPVSLLRVTSPVSNPQQNVCSSTFPLITLQRHWDAVTVCTFSGPPAGATFCSVLFPSLLCMHLCCYNFPSLTPLNLRLGPLYMLLTEILYR